MSRQITKWLKEIESIKEELHSIGEMRPGSLTEQYNVCGNPNCRCKDPDNPQKHGPYYQLSYTHARKSTSEFVKADDVEIVRAQLANYVLFRTLTNEWIDLSVRIAKLRKEEAKKVNTKS